MKTRSPLIWFGGKGKVAKKIISRMPAHKTYVEPFGGAAHVITQKSQISHEVYNDIDGDLVNFLLVARDLPEKLSKACESLPYSRQLYGKWKSEEMPEDEFERAVRFFYLNRSGIAKGNGPGSCKTGWRHSTSSNQNPAMGYQSACSLIKAFANRMKGVMIEHDDFRKIIEKYDSPQTLFYVDPPYIGREKFYAGGFTEQDHRELAGPLQNIKGKAIVSYYDDPLLLEIYPDWRRETFESYKQVVNGDNCHAEELLLMNFKEKQMNIFDI
ncbi:site-specific DNA-adenine methylase [Aneurinibacillus soli]|uniref:DNA adenine methylase n=1 Tax=Aneurinibacillus soli TaxID=1500254 RepID=A0A0U5BD45_9BACL|nr:site-specific DNA-adenine methylase [Aneurinibacillus soli]BAU28119.1 DNA adenine methylase [Aneurinibacillus soli]